MQLVEQGPAQAQRRPARLPARTAGTGAHHAGAPADPHLGHRRHLQRLLDPGRLLQHDAGRPADLPGQLAAHAGVPTRQPGRLQQHRLHAAGQGDRAAHRQALCEHMAGASFSSRPACWTAISTTVPAPLKAGDALNAARSSTYYGFTTCQGSMAQGQLGPTTSCTSTKPCSCVPRQPGPWPDGAPAQHRRDGRPLGWALASPAMASCTTAGWDGFWTTDGHRHPPQARLGSPDQLRRPAQVFDIERLVSGALWAMVAEV